MKTPWQLWIWRQWRLELPADWELLQFSKQPAAGTCAFADRHDFRLELHWREVPGPPDFARVLHDYEAQLIQDERSGEIGRRTVGAWQGLLSRRDALWTHRYGRYVEPLHCLIELVFRWPTEPDFTLEDEVLTRAAMEPPGADGRQRWRAFGLDLLVAPGLAFTSCDVAPGRALLAFKHPKDPDASQHAERLGLLAAWLHVPVRDWLAGKLPKDVRHERWHPESRCGHTAETVTGELPPRKFPRWGRQVFFHAAAWICPADGRLYLVYLQQPVGRQATGLQGVGDLLSCCQPRRATAAAPGSSG